MTIQRQLFQVSTDTGTQGDTGPPFFGEIAQLRWNPTTADTGADLRIDILPKTADTGDGWNVLNDNDVLGTNFVRVLRQDTHDGAGVSDTGSAPIIGAGDRIRIKVTPGGAAAAGRLYIWIKN